MCTNIRLFIPAFLLVCSQAVSAHAVTFHWSQAYGDAADQIATSVALDPTGNIILIGHFDGSVDFGGGPLVCGGTTSNYLAKLDRYGNHVWSRSLGDSLEHGTNRLAVDGSGNVFIASDYRGTVDLGGGPLTAVGFRDGLIAKYDAYGNHVWSKNFGGTSALVEVAAAGVDGFGDLIVAGTFTGTIDFGGGSLSASSFVTNIFIVKFGPTGAPVWSRKHTGGMIEITTVVGDAAGNVILAGYHGDDFDFGGGALSPNLFNIFLAKYDYQGNHTWSNSYGSNGNLQYAFDAAVDAMGNIFVTGHFKEPLDLGGGPMVSAGGWDMYLAKFAPGGGHMWSQRFGDGNTQRGYTVSVDGAGNAIVGGHFFYGVDFGGGALVGDPIDYCVARFDASGNHVWSQRLDVYNLGLPNDKPYAIAAAANPAGDMAFVGSFKDAVDCGGGSLSGSGAFDTFVASFHAAPTATPEPGPGRLALDAFPNPFNPATTLTWSNPAPGNARLVLYDIKGRHIRTLVDEWVAAGEQTARWNGRDARGEPAASGVYFVRLETGGVAETMRIVLLK